MVAGSEHDVGGARNTVDVTYGEHRAQLRNPEGAFTSTSRSGARH